MRELQPQIMSMNGNANIFNALVGEVREYAKKNPGIEPVLQNTAVWKNIMAANKTQNK